jgi:two-component system, sensor histidine kinase YcbA
MIRIRKYILLSFITALFGELYIMPFKNNFRISAGIIVLNLIFIIDDEIYGLPLSILSGLLILFERSTMQWLLTGSSIYNALILNSPSLVYYITYGVLIYILKLRFNRQDITKMMLYIMTIDIVSNISEALVRGQINPVSLKYIIAAGFLRILLAYLVYLLYNRQKLFILKKEHQTRYSELTILASNIQAELFYLRKSMKDIEDIMSKSYNLYDRYKYDKNLSEETLDIAREIHEVKKDYYRIINGFEAIMSGVSNEGTMKLSNIFKIIEENTSRYIMESGKKIRLNFILKDNFEISDYYSLFAILNNLIINSIEACKDGDLITIKEYKLDRTLCIEVVDTGEGIEADMLPYIFNPGFTTKYDPITGKTSTGIGLSHIKNILEKLGGTISVESSPGLGTSFRLNLPINI